MKTTVILLITTLFLFSSVRITSAQPTSSEQEEIQEKIESLDRDLAALKLKMNRLIFEKYFEQAEQSRIAPPVFGLRTFHSKSLYDTVPHLGALENAYQAAYEDWQAIMKTDKQYNSIHEEYMKLRGSKDQAALNRNREKYNEMYARLRANNPDYEPVNERRSEAMFARNIAITRFLLDYYHGRGEELPTHIIPDQQLRDIMSNVELINLKQEQSTLLLIRSRLNIRLMNLKYDYKQDNQEKWEKSTTLIDL